MLDVEKWGDRSGLMYPSIDGSRPYFINEQQVCIPYIHMLTEVNLPPEIDLTNKAQVIQVVSALVNEEIALNPRYKGALLYGSVSRGEALNGQADIDIMHVVESRTAREDFCAIAEAMQFRMEALFSMCYGIVADVHRVLDINSRRYGWNKNVGSFLDRYPVPIGISAAEYRALSQEIGNVTRSYVVQKRKPEHFFPSGPHCFQFPVGGIFDKKAALGLRVGINSQYKIVD